MIKLGGSAEDRAGVDKNLERISLVDKDEL
jgi:hypothetical protein